MPRPDTTQLHSTLIRLKGTKKIRKSGDHKQRTSRGRRSESKVARMYGQPARVQKSMLVLKYRRGAAKFPEEDYDENR
jgi:hypothetical protein